MRKTFYLPEHIRDRLLKFRQRHEMMDEQVAIIRLIDAGLRVEEDQVPSKEDKVDKSFPLPLKPWLEWQDALRSWYKMNGRIR